MQSNSLGEKKYANYDFGKLRVPCLAGHFFMLGEHNPEAMTEMTDLVPSALAQTGQRAILLTKHSISNADLPDNECVQDRILAYLPAFYNEFAQSLVLIQPQREKFHQSPAKIYAARFRRARQRICNCC